jgi:N-dimethylarginine dimethylaminohydrolase
MNDSTVLTSPQPRYLMCRPQYFAVTYSINPWMNPQAWAECGAVLHAVATRQWADFHRTLLENGAVIETIEPRPELPDLVFTANAAVVLDRKALLAHFRHRERQREHPVTAEAFRGLKARGIIDEIVEMPEDIAIEGAGDCIWDRTRGLFWLGCGFRSEPVAARVIEEYFGVRCVPLALADPSFYHLDTAFCALPRGEVIYFPGAFTPAALETIHSYIAPDECIALERADATDFAANAVCLGRTVVLSSCSVALRRRLERHGYMIVKTPLQAFQRSGGSACCLTLRLDHQTRPVPASVAPAAAAAGPS